MKDWVFALLLIAAMWYGFYFANLYAKINARYRLARQHQRRSNRLRRIKVQYYEMELDRLRQQLRVYHSVEDANYLTCKDVRPKEQRFPRGEKEIDPLDATVWQFINLK